VHLSQPLLSSGQEVQAKCSQAPGVPVPYTGGASSDSSQACCNFLCSLHHYTPEHVKMKPTFTRYQLLNFCYIIRDICSSGDADCNRWMDIYPRKFEPCPFIFRELLPNLSVASRQRTPHSICACPAKKIKNKNKNLYTYIRGGGE